MNSALLRRLRQFASGRHNQRKAPFFVVEGLRCCLELLGRRPQWVETALLSDEVAETANGQVFVGAVRAAGVPLEIIDANGLAQVVLTEGPQGMLCVARKPGIARPTRLDRICTLILDQVREPGNVGTILRTAWSIGLSQVWFIEGSADPWSPKVIRSGMGAQFAVNVHHFPDLSNAVQLFRKLGGGEVWCAMMHSSISLFSSDFTPFGSALVVGNEGHGISRPELGSAVTIPMPGQAESLNVAQATTLLLYEALRRGRST
ncbi:MAG: RNA methyltransferase [Victivallales bacterium]|nr:RNA methyltransferase [Victivallales bacterium]